MSLPHDTSLKLLARSLRVSMTDAERRLWSAIRGKQVGGRLFTRQKTIARFIVDFSCASAALVIELDGGQHYTDEGREQDRQRDFALRAMGLQVLRFSDREVLTRTEEVLEVIWRACAGGANPLAPPFPKGEEGASPHPLPGRDASDGIPSLPGVDASDGFTPLGKGGRGV